LTTLITLVTTITKAAFASTRTQSSEESQSSKNTEQISLPRPIRSHVDYNFFNYCFQCSVKLFKVLTRCLGCRRKVRTRPWHPQNVLNHKEFSRRGPNTSRLPTFSQQEKQGNFVRLLICTKIFIYRDFVTFC